MVVSWWKSGIRFRNVGWWGISVQVDPCGVNSSHKAGAFHGRGSGNSPSSCNVRGGEWTSGVFNRVLKLLLLTWLFCGTYQWYGDLNASDGIAFFTRGPSHMGILTKSAIFASGSLRMILCYPPVVNWIELPVQHARTMGTLLKCALFASRSQEW